ncbi:MAG: glycosyltransferase involved in cell wall biosynthesis [Saprospiraceae bacterium]|jgi:glycosyltransferase involved in cell wall biosynthesis
MITAVIITLNEESKIDDCIKSLSSVCDQCIVVDAESTDETVKKAQALKAEVHSIHWVGYGAARNYGASKARNPWILAIDADERLDENLINSLQSVQLEEKTIYRFNRLTRYCGQWIRNGVWHPEWKSKLYHRDFYEWNHRLVHEDLVSSQGRMQFEKLNGKLLHKAYQTHEQLEYRLDKYARLSIEEKVTQNQPSSFFKRFFSPRYHFFRSYLWKKGFLDGRAGLKIAKAIETYHRKKLNYIL